MPFPENLRRARHRAGLTQCAAAQMLGITTSTYCGYETGKRQPDLVKLRRLAQAFGASTDDLLGLSRPSTEYAVSHAEFAHIKKCRALDAHGRRLVQLVVDEELSRLSAPASPEQEKALFRVSEQPAAAGLGVYLGPDAFRTVCVARDLLPRSASFGVPVRGDSMEPRYHDGDILIVSASLPEQGDIGVFVMDGMGYVKVMGQGELLSLNPAYTPIPMTEGIRACGKVIGAFAETDIE